MVKKSRKRGRIKKKQPTLVVWIGLGAGLVLLVLGLAQLQDSGYLRTQLTAVPSPGYIVQDWIIPSPPPVIAVVSAETLCPSPSPTPSPSSTATPTPTESQDAAVLGLHASACQVGREGPVPKEYTISKVENLTVEISVRGKDVPEIIKTACLGTGKELPVAGRGALGAAWYSIGETGRDTPFAARLHGLIKTVEGKIRFSPGLVLPNYPDREGQVEAPAVYAVAPDDPDDDPEKIPVVTNVIIWTLHGDDVDKLKAVHPRLVDLIAIRLRDTKAHEERHRLISRPFIDAHTNAINNPPVPGSTTLKSEEEAIEAMKTSFKAAWMRRTESEIERHRTFHASPEGFIGRKKNIPIKGLEHLQCSDSKNFILQVYAGVLRERADSPVNGQVKLKAPGVIIGGGGDKSFVLVSVFKGEKITYTAVPDEGYKFVAWRKGSGVGSCPCDGQGKEQCVYTTWFQPFNATS